MTLHDLIEKAKRYPVPVVCGSVTLLCFMVFYFRMDVISDLEIQFDEVAGRAEQVEENVRSGLSLEEHLAQVKATVAEIEHRIIRPAELDVNLRYFYRLESETGVSLADLRQIGPVAPPKTGPKRSFVPVSYSLILSGTFQQTVAFFNELESGPRFFRLRGFNLQRGREQDTGIVTLSLNLELLGWP